jgi:hypothetical protein
MFRRQVSAARVSAADASVVETADTRMKTAFFVVTMSCPSGDHCKHEAEGIAGVWSAHAATWKGRDMTLLSARKWAAGSKARRDHVLKTRLFLLPLRTHPAAATYNMTVSAEPRSIISA